MLGLLSFASGFAVLLLAPDGPRYAVIGALLCVAGIPSLLAAYRESRRASARMLEQLDGIERDLDGLEERLDADLEREREEDAKKEP